MFTPMAPLLSLPSLPVYLSSVVQGDPVPYQSSLFRLGLRTVSLVPKQKQLRLHLETRGLDRTKLETEVGVASEICDESGRQR